MGIFPTFNNNYDLESNSESYLPVLKNFAINFETGELIIKDGDFVIVEKDEAIAVWCYYAIKTQKGRYLMYPRKFGNSFEDDFIGKDYEEGVDKRLDKMLRECLLQSDYIKSVDSINIEFKDDTITGYIYITTVYTKGVRIDV